MEITHTFQKGICIVNPVGDLVGANVPLFKEYLSPFLDDPALRGMIVNFQEVGFISSSGISVVISSAIKVKRRNAQLILTHLNANNNESLRISGVTKAIPMYPTLQEALENLEK